MLSRVAESVYWMSRYVERAENIARFIDVNLQLVLDAPTGQHQWQPVVNARIPPAGVVEFLILDRRFPRSVQCNRRGIRCI